MFAFKRKQNEKETKEKKETGLAIETHKCEKILPERNVKSAMGKPSPSLQYVDLTNSMQVKAGILYFNNAISRPSIVNKKDNPNEERFSYVSCIPDVSSKAMYMHYQIYG